MYPLLKLGVYEDLRTRITSSYPYYSCLIACLVDNPFNIQTEEIVGTIEISVRSFAPWSNFIAKSPYICNLAIKNTHRRQGIARKLLLKCEQKTNEWGFSQLFLHVLEDNHQASQLYFSSGYKLKQAESNLTNWLWQSPRRLLLTKNLGS